MRRRIQHARLPCSIGAFATLLPLMVRQNTGLQSVYDWRFSISTMSTNAEELLG